MNSSTGVRVETCGGPFRRASASSCRCRLLGLRHGASASENNASEASHGDGKVDRADDKHGHKRLPHEREISAAEQHRLRKGDEMRCRTDCPHYILEPDRHAFHWGAAAGKQLRGGENRHCQQSELTHGGRECAEENSKGSNHQGVKGRAKEKQEQRSRN